MDIRSEIHIIENPTTKTVAVATIIIDECFVVKGIKVLDGANGFFISMPNRKAANGEYKDIAYPITKEAREQITESVLEEYERKLSEKPKTEQFEQANNSNLPF